MGMPPIDLTGRRFGKLVVKRAELVREPQGGLLWICRCDCGREKTVAGRSLRYGVTRSCGCLSRARHGHAGNSRIGKRPSPTYRSWQAMLNRCLNRKQSNWKHYGGRGIKVCKRWLKFENFLADMGVRPPRMTLDRKDNDGDYKKSNCEWALHPTQMKNRRPFTEEHKRNMRGPRKKGYKQSPQHIARRVASYKVGRRRRG